MLSFAVILFRTVLCVAAVMILIAVTPFTDITDFLRLMHVPAVFSDLPEMNGEHPDNGGLLNDLLSNGIITQAEYDALSEAIEE